MKSYLDKLMHMAVHHLVEGHIRNLLELLRRHNLVCPSHGCPSIYLDAGPYFLFSIVSSLELLGPGNDLLDGDTWKARRPSSKVGVDEPFSITSFSFSFSTTLNLRAPILEKGLFFFALILAFNSWLNLVVISAEGRNKVKIRKRQKEEKTIIFQDQDNSCFLSSQWIAQRT